MSQRGRLRPIFAELAACNGCYVIVSLHDDPTGNAATIRRDAMRRQLDKVRSRGDVQSAFYGCGELVDWLAQHPGVQLWTRNTLGIPLDGWKPYGPWTFTPPADSDDLICEPGLQVVLPRRDASPLQIEAGIEEIRSLVRTSDRAVRVVGLSGVGKTRLVQALFEESVGDDPLAASLAMYADLGTDPEPSPRTMLARLAADNHPAILVLDNCPVDTHNLLAAEASTTPEIHLITIEYDIREDRPEITTVVRINAEGHAIVQALISRRFPQLGGVNCQKIAEFSGGNARLGLVLADAVSDTENLSDFSNSQLFDRLFYQAGARDSALLAAAQALSLVYSYSMRADEDGVNELATLASLAGQDRRSLFAATQTLVRRRLAQQRGHWRAILPPAVSNRLASDALDNIPPEDLPEVFESLANPRLLKSFGRRLGYLHDHDRAQEIVRSWLSPGGLLHTIEALDAHRIQLLENVAPVAPDAVLDTIEIRARQPGSGNFFSDDNSNARAVAVLLCSIAYDAALFERCIALLTQFATALSQPRQPQSDVSRRLFALFALYLSGTEAGPDLRERAIRRSLFDARRDERDIGLGMLDVALKSGHWGSFAVFEFGARPRTYGYWPRTAEEQDRWFLRFISLVREAATSDHADLLEPARALLAGEFRQLWQFPTLRSSLSVAARSVHTRKSWPEGWRAVRSVKCLDYGDADETDIPDGIELLNELDDYLRPARPADEVRTYVFDVGHQHFSLFDEFDDEDEPSWRESNRVAAERAHDLGVAVSSVPDTLDELSLELFIGEFGFRVAFGEGLASACHDPSALWRRLVGYLALAGDGARHCDVLCGVLDAIRERDEALATALFCEAAASPTLRPCIVNLHPSVANSCEAGRSLLRALDFDDTPLNQFGLLASQRPPRGPTEALLRDVYLRLLEKPGGPKVVLFGLSMRIRASQQKALGFGPDLKRVGLLASTAILRDAPYQHDGTREHQVSTVLECCLDGTEFPAESDQVFDAFLSRVSTTYGTTGGLHSATAVVAGKLPVRFLDGIFLNTTFRPTHLRALFSERHQRANALDRIGIATLIDWCRQGEFQERLVMLSEAVHPFANAEDSEWIRFTALAHTIIDATDNPSVILGNFATSIRPSGYSGSLADIFARRRHPFELLRGHEREDVRDAAEGLIPHIRGAEDRERERESTEDQERDQRFE